MRIAHDESGNRIHAKAYIKGTKCFCPECGEPVRHRNGKIRIPHFAHIQKSNCSWGSDMSEWHVRMQDYFPIEQQEVRFKDKETGEIHIADVFVKDKNTVIEFQHSPIKEEEFISRTAFHINNGRRIVWVFDESKEEAPDGDLGRLRPDSLIGLMEWPYTHLQFKWLRMPRKCLLKGPDLREFGYVYSICIYNGTEGDTLHRIVFQDNSFKEIVLSLHNIVMNDGIDVDDFFQTDNYWISQPPLKEQIEQELRVRNSRPVSVRPQIKIGRRPKRRRGWL